MELSRSSDSIPASKGRSGGFRADAVAKNEEAASEAMLFECAPLAMVVIGSSGRIVRWNSAAEHLLGWLKPDVLGDQSRTFSAKDRASFEAELKKIVGGNPERSQWEAKAQQRDGSLLDVMVWRAPLPAWAAEGSGSMAIIADITDHKSLERVLLATTERETRRIGQELHDNLCQHLLGAAFSVKAVAAGLSPELPATAELNELAHLINSAVQLARDIARGLNPVTLDAAGLMAALRELAERPYPGFRCRLDCARPVLLPDTATAVHAYRVAQEAVANAVQHSGGTEIEIRLWEDASEIQLEISDNGRGCAVSKDSSGAGIGLQIMKHRAMALAGRLTIDATEMGGMRVRLALPKTK